MRCFVRCFAFLALIFIFLPSHYTMAQVSGWRLVANQDGIKVFTRVVKGSGYEAFKGVARVRANFKNLLAILADTRTNCKWMHECGKPTILKQVSFTERYIYQVNYLPAPLWNRDIIMHSVATANKKGDVVTIRLKAVPQFCDQLKLRTCRNLDQRGAGKNYVRIQKAAGFFQLRKLSNKLVEVTWQMHADPGGDVFGWMANLSLVDIPFKTLKGLKSYVKVRGNRKTRLKIALK